jgi:hypothetical protein
VCSYPRNAKPRLWGPGSDALIPSKGGQKTLLYCIVLFSNEDIEVTEIEFRIKNLVAGTDIHHEMKTAKQAKPWRRNPHARELAQAVCRPRVGAGSTSIVMNSSTVNC